MPQYALINEDRDVSYKTYDDQEGSERRRSSSSEGDLFLEKNHALQKIQPFYRKHSRSIVTHILVLLCNVILCFAVWQWSKQDCHYGVYGPELTYTPAKDAIEYESQQWDHTNIYFRNGSVNTDRLHKEFGPPSQELDDAWADLIQYQNIRLKKEELGEFSNMPGLVELGDGSGYYATLSAYHSLHCIKRLHHLMYFDHYYPGKTDLEAMLIKQHGEHCLNILKQTVQCNPDLSVLLMQLGATTRIPIGLDEGHHQCLNWGRIDTWMKERSLDVFQPGMIVHPTLGEAYPNGKGDDLGVAIDHLLGEDLAHGHGHEHGSGGQEGT